MKEHSVFVNGINIYSMTNPHLRSFCLSLYVRAGSIFETPDNNGISHLFEHVVFRNLKNRYENFYEMLAFHGLELYAGTYKEFIRFYIEGPSGEFDLAAEILCSLFSEIQLSRADFVNEKKRIKAEIRENDECSTLQFFFNRIVWKDTGAEKNIIGYCKTIDKISVKKINAFRKEVLSGGNCFVYVTGNVPQSGLETLRQRMGTLEILRSEADFRNVITPNAEFFNRGGKVYVKDDYWHHIKIGFDVDCSKYPGGVYDLLYAVLFTGTKAVAHNYLSEDNPIVYSYDSAFEQYDNIGNLYFDFEVDKNKIEEAFAIVGEMFKAVKEGRFNFEATLRDELYNAQLCLDRPRNLNFNMAYYNHILKTEPFDYSKPGFGRFDVTKKQLISAANEVFCARNMTVAIKGNKRKLKPEVIEEKIRGCRI